MTSQHWKAYYCLGCDKNYLTLLPNCPCCEGSVSVVACTYCDSEDIERRPELDVVNVRGA